MRPTPYVQVDPDVVDANIASMQRFADGLGVALRPHAKTHKSVEIARRQLAAGAVGLTVATVAEAEVFAGVVAAAGRDIVVAYPVAVPAARLRALNARVPVIVGVDSTAGVDRAAAAGVPVYVEVDCGLRRSGVTPADAAGLAAHAAARGVEVAGLFTFPGHGYAGGDARERAAAEEAVALAAAAGAVRDAGVDVAVRSGGCTPTVRLSHREVVTELRPGVYVFMDAQQLALGAATADEVALTVRATVTSTAVPGQFIIDAGAKVLGMDRPGYVDGHGLLPSYPHATIARVWEHHGVVEVGDGPRAALGEQVVVVPNHVCATVNLVDEFVVGDATWPVSARGANT